MKPGNICAFESCVRDGKLREGVVGRSKLKLLNLGVGVQWRETKGSRLSHWHPASPTPRHQTQGSQEKRV